MKTINLRLAMMAMMFTVFMGCSSDSGSGDCEPIACQNGGIFQDCQCDCPDGYDGQDCTIEVQPSKIWITKVRVKKFANSDGFTGWDGPGTSPDLRLEIEKVATSVFLSNTFYPNVLSAGNDAYDFTITNPIETTSGNSILNLVLLDYDQEDTIPSDDDYMGSAYFSPYSDFTGFPMSMTVNDPAGNYRFEVFLTYEWN
jgi:hypothetical protein